jgi:hypothetical protein
LRTASALLVALLLQACSSASTPAPTAPAPPVEARTEEASGSAAPAAEALVSCRLTRAEELVEALELRSEDGGCRLMLPLAVVAGPLPIRVGAVPGEQAAAFEAGSGADRFYASEGTVTVAQADANLLRGTVEARDANPPGLARLSATFEVRRNQP